MNKSKTWKNKRENLQISLLCLILCGIFPTLSAAEYPVTVSGLTEPINDVILSFDVNGTIAEIFFKEGDRVEKGARILELEKKFEELEVRRSKLIWESKVEVDSSKVRSNMLKLVYESTLSLYKKTGSVSKEELDKKQLEYDLAEAEYQRLAIAEKREELEYRMAMEKRDKLIMISPIPGTITELMLDAGESCENRQPLAHVVDTSKCLLVCNIEAPLAQNLTKGQNVDLAIPVGFETLSLKGTLIFVAPVVDPASGLVMVKAQFDNKDGAVRPGVAGSMIIPVQSDKTMDGNDS
ncbi:MAG: efflux RND transporter periplasmic adaptor subunit [Proteobacteria bacterium]|nr:efflux RND transporter periplasmic adaptor subunit [Pseudomonadota bacterium]